MKRDMDLIRDLLLKIEDAGSAPSSTSLIADRCEEEKGTVIDHLRLIQEAGLIKCISSTPISGRWRAQNIELTWQGHDFLDTVRDPEVWKRTKAGASKIGGAAFSVIKDMAIAYGKHVAKERLGIDL